MKYRNVLSNSKCSLLGPNLFRRLAAATRVYHEIDRSPQIWHFFPLNSVKRCNLFILHSLNKYL